MVRLNISCVHVNETHKILPFRIINLQWIIEFEDGVLLVVEVFEDFV